MRHQFLDAQHTLRGRGCTMAENSCSSSTFFFSFSVVHASVFCLQQWKTNLWGHPFHWLGMLSVSAYAYLHSSWKTKARVLMSTSQSVRNATLFLPIFRLRNRAWFETMQRNIKKGVPYRLTAALLRQAISGYLEGSYCNGEYFWKYLKISFTNNIKSYRKC